MRITFFYFSSAFNAIQPLLLGEKLHVMGVNDTVISWITDYLTGRPQFVHMGSVLSNRTGCGHRHYRQMLGAPSSTGGAKNGGRKIIIIKNLKRQFFFFLPVPLLLLFLNIL